MATTKAFLLRVRRKMDREGHSQSEVAGACDLSQGHLSRVLRGLLPLTEKTKNRLVSWLDRSSDQGKTEERAISIVRRLVASDAGKATRVLAVLTAMEEALR